MSDKSSEQDLVEQEQIEADEETSASDKSASSNKPKTQRPSKWPAAIAIIALLATAGGLYTGYQHWLQIKSSLSSINDVLAKANTEQSALKQQLQTESDKIVEQSTRISSQDSKLSEATDALENTKQTMQTQLETTHQALDDMSQRMGRSSKDWKAAEAEYLIRIANHRLQLEQDFRTAISALEAADSQLKEAADPKYTGVRDTLAQEILSLKAVTPIDRVGIAAKLAAVSKAIKQLKPNLLVVEEATKNHQAGDDSGEKSWKTLGEDLMKGLKSALVIRRHDKPVNAMLTPQQYQLVLESMRLQVEAARYAAIKGDTALYQQSLSNSIQWLKDYFDSEEAAGVSNSLTALKAESLTLDTPDISQSLAQLRSIIAQRENKQ